MGGGRGMTRGREVQKGVSVLGRLNKFKTVVLFHPVRVVCGVDGTNEKDKN